MKKNISINISGIIFHIEEDGYETLRKYLDAVNKYFAAFDDNSEILADIEGRIAEIFLSRLNDGKQVITSEDVSSLIATMGSVNDFKAAEEQEFAAGDNSKSEPRPTSAAGSSATKKLFRDQRRKILGGVCAGLGHYFNVDPVWPRLFLALLVLASSGFFLIVYIVLWILLPASVELEDQSNVKKMFRDPDRKVLGGVAGGIAAFLGTDIALIRIIFVVLLIPGLIGAVLYIVLWIVLPEAKTITEKMKMQGEPVTLSNIESTVKKGMNEKDGSEESALTKIILFPFRIIAAVLSALGPVLKVILDVVRVAIGLAILLTGVSLMLALLLSFGILVGLINAPHWEIFTDWYLNAPNLPLAAFRNSFPTWTVVFTFLAAFIPALFVMLLGSSIINKRLAFRPAVGWTLFGIFFISVAVISFSLPQIIYGFKEEGEYNVENSYEFQGKTPYLKINETGMDDYHATSLSLRGYQGAGIKVVEHFESQGPSRKIAGENARMVDYYVTQSDSVLSFDSNITFKPEAKFRAQRLDVDIFVPYKQKFVVDANLWRLIDTHVIQSRDYYRFSLNEDTQTWQMTEDGLECVSCPAETERLRAAHDEFGLKDFNSIDLKGLFNVRISKGDDYAVELDGSESERKRYNVYVSGETLVIDYKNRNKFFWKRNLLDVDAMKINIIMPELRELDVTGAGKLKFRGFDENEMDIKLMGAIVGEGDINATTLNVELTGASSLDLSGNGKFMDAEIVGASSLRAYGYEVKDCTVKAHGASIAKVNVTNKLEIDKGIASSVSHRGDPEVIKR
jgi:phage shock protein PspC (stress-responsive transcriptional regulator)